MHIKFFLVLIFLLVAFTQANPVEKSYKDIHTILSFMTKKVEKDMDNVRAYFVRMENRRVALRKTLNEQVLEEKKNFLESKENYDQAEAALEKLMKVLQQEAKEEKEIRDKELAENSRQQETVEKIYKLLEMNTSGTTDTQPKKKVDKTDNKNSDEDKKKKIDTSDDSKNSGGKKKKGKKGNNCDCPEESKPVCGSDGKIYPNKCVATCKGVTSREGQCVQKRMTNTCKCPSTKKPVCGSNGKTYKNSCLAKCKNVKFMEGPCKEKKKGKKDTMDKMKNCEKALEEFKKLTFRQALALFRKPWGKLLGGVVKKYKCNKKPFSDEWKKKKKDHKEAIKVKKEKNCVRALGKYKSMSWEETHAEYQKSWTKFMNGVVARNQCKKKPFKDVHDDKKKENEAKKKAEKEKTCARLLEYFEKMTWKHASTEMKKSWKLFLSGRAKQCNKDKFSKVYQEKKKKHEDKVKDEARKECAKALKRFKAMSWEKVHQEYSKSWNDFLDGLNLEYKCPKTPFKKVHDEKKKEHDANSQKLSAERCKKLLKHYKTLSKLEKTHQSIKPWFLFLKGLPQRNGCDRNDFRKIDRENGIHIN